MNDDLAFATLARRVARGLARLERDEICCGSITLQQFDTLRIVQEAKGLTTGDLAARLGIDLSTASRNLTVLEREGYLVRARSRVDGRQVLHKLSRKGTACVESMCCDERSIFGAVLARVPEGDRARVFDALGVLAGALDAPASCEAGACCGPGADVTPIVPHSSPPPPQEHPHE